MSVLYLLPSLTALGGGIEQHDRQHLEAMARLRPGQPLGVVLARERGLAHPDKLSTELRALLRVSGTDSSSRWRRLGEFAARAAWSAARERPSLIIAGHAHFAPHAWLLARGLGCPYAVMLHGIEAWAIHRGPLAEALRRATLLISVSRYTVSRVQTQLGIGDEKFVVLPNLIDRKRFFPGPVAESVARKLQHLSHPRLLTVGRLDAGEGYKGVDVVIEALAQKRIDASYLVIGSGSDRPRLEALAAQKNVRAHFYGYAPDEELADLYRACDWFVMPSRGEGFGCVYLEALACGLRVIAGNADGSREALGDGAAGTLVDTTPEAVGAAIVHNLAAGDENQQARRKVIEELDLETLPGRLEPLLLRLGQ